jgi:hypothetical protein
MWFSIHHGVTACNGGLTARCVAGIRGRLFAAGTDAWFEDLEVYRDGELMFGIITHEHEGVVGVRDEELARLDARGFRYRGAGQ